MSPLIAAIIIAVTPTFDIRLREPSTIISATVAYTDSTGESWELAAYPSAFIADLPASATGLGMYRIYIESSTEEVETRGGILWNLFPTGYRAFKPVMHDPIPPPKDQQWRSWPYTYWGRPHWQDHVDKWSPHWRLIHVAIVGNKFWTLWEERQ